MWAVTQALNSATSRTAVAWKSCAVGGGLSFCHHLSQETRGRRVQNFDMGGTDTVSDSQTKPDLAALRVGALTNCSAHGEFSSLKTEVVLLEHDMSNGLYPEIGSGYDVDIPEIMSGGK